MASVAKLIERMRYWCVEANMGYSQSDRWNFNPAGGNCDCSSLVIHCLQEAGFDTGGASYTGNLSANLTARGWARVGNNGNPQPGDIL
ncbi:MAG: peptidoglycan hydrolase, partial [Bifidobacterium sp.]|nr:peptidoglycan hydrolase [Bifidobacterium sp.]